MAKMGRPRKEIDQNQFESLCGLQCTELDICAWFDCCEDTLNAWCKRTYDGDTFSEAYKRFSAVGNASLRRMQWRLAEKSATMAIFLGKQYLGQRDIHDIDLRTAPLDDSVREMEAYLDGSEEEDVQPPEE